MPLRVVPRAGSPHLYLRGTVRGISVFESTGTHDEDAADEIRITREKELLKQSIHGKKATVTFIAAAVAYMENGGSARFLGKVDEATGKWSGLIGHFGTKKLMTLGQAELDDAAKKLLPNAAPDTRNRQVHTPFVAVWNYAADAGWADHRRWRRPRKPKKGTAVRRKPTRAGTRPVTYDVACSFVVAMSPAPAMVMTALFFTGMRPIEMFALEAPDVFPDQQWIVLDGTKSDEPRGVPMHPFLVPLFVSLKARGGVLFRSRLGTPYPLTEDGGGQIANAVAGARKRTGLLDISPYTARHTVSTQLVLNGVHPHVKDQILGHAVTDMSRRYTHVPQQPLIEAIETIRVPEEWRTLPWWQDPAAWVRRGIAFKKRAKHVQPISDDAII